MSEKSPSSLTHKEDWVARFEWALAHEMGASPHTVAAYTSDLHQLYQSQTPPDDTWSDWTPERLRQYLFFDHAFSASTIARKLSAFRAFFHFLQRQGKLLTPPLKGLKAPRAPGRSPKLLTEKEVQSLLSSPYLKAGNNSALKCRDKALLELLYATGCRVSELVALKKCDFFEHEGLVKILGKGGHERLVPLHREAIEDLKHYLQQFRGRLHPKAPLLASLTGQRLSRQAVWKRLKACGVHAGLKSSQLSPHVIRHAFATHLMNRGADLRVVQTLLGHRQLATTQIYTHMAQAKLSALHQRFHLREGSSQVALSPPDLK